jgi:DNA polymerase I-like protein with 3'-5' exonuclease and polymerase domains
MTKRLDRPEIRVFLDRSSVESLCEELLAESGINSIDTEWYNYDRKRGPAFNASAFCIQLGWERDSDSEIQLAYVHNHGESAGNIHALAPWLRSAAHPKLAHNAPVDWHVIANEGIVMEGVTVDTMVLDHLVDENRENEHGLKECVRDYFGVHRKSFNETYGAPKLTKDGLPYASGQLIVPPLDEVDMSDPVTWQKHLEYSCDDVWDALMLYKRHRATLEATPWFGEKTMWDYYMAVDSPITRIICKMERKGMTLDVPFLREMSEVCGEDLEQMLAKACEWAGAPFNVGSDKQLGHLLYGHGTLPIMKGKRTLFSIPGKGWPVLKRTPGGAPSTSAEALVELRRELEKGIKVPEAGTNRTRLVRVPKGDLEGFDWILNYSKFSTQKSTFLDGMVTKQRNGRIHGRINQIGTTSSRFSASDPNLQNITTGEKDVYHLRDCFTAPPGFLLIVADWAQLEYRLLAHYSQDPTLLKMFVEGWDMHSLTTANIFPHIKREVETRFGGITAEALKWVAETYPNERKKGKCVHPDTLIHTETGYRTVGDVVGAGSADSFTRPDARQVQTPSGPLRINAGYVGQEVDQLVVVTRHNAIVCRPEHLFQTTSGTMVRADHLHLGWELEEATVEPLRLEENPWLPVKLWEDVPETMQYCTPDLAYFAGVFHGAGTNNESSASITHGPVDRPIYRAWQQELVSLCRGLGLAPEAKRTFTYFGSRVVLRWLESLGLAQPGGKRKKMSVPTWAMSLELFPHYFAGLADTDGTVGKDGRLSITTKWPTYAGQLATLLRACGVSCSVEATLNKTYERHYYRVFLSKADGHRFMKRLLRLPHKRDRLLPGSRSYQPEANEVTALIPYGKAPCVDLNVKGHVYCANGLVTHNTLNFEIIYGVGHKKLGDQLRISHEDAKQMIDGWFRAYPGVKAWMNRLLSEYRTKGFTRLLDGRIRHANMARLNHKEYWIRGSEERTLINGKIQGSAAAMARRAMIRIDECDELRELGYGMTMQVHDEIVGEAPMRAAKRVVELIRPIMEQPFSKPLRVAMPVSLGVGPSWSTAKV